MMSKKTTIFILTAVFLFLSFSVFSACLAAEGKYTLLESVPGAGDSPSLSTYVGAMVKVGIVTAAILAVVMIVIAGFMYITAGGNTGTTEKAKEYIWGAVIGLLIAVSYYLILNTINPSLINIKDLIPSIDITKCLGEVDDECTETKCLGEGKTCKSSYGEKWKWDKTQCACVREKTYTYQCLRVSMSVTSCSSLGECEEETDKSKCANCSQASDTCCICTTY